MLALGTPAPDFRLSDPFNKVFTLKDFSAAPALVVMFICNHCPFVKHLRSELAAFGKECAARGAAVVAICSNDATKYPEDAPARMAAAGYTFPYLVDATQEVAKAYHAACTPDFFVFDRARRLVYRGQFDESRPGNGAPVTGADLRAAVDAVLAGTPVKSEQWPSVGCNIKWRAGNEPGYAR